MNYNFNYEPLKAEEKPGNKAPIERRGATVNEVASVAADTDTDTPDIRIQSTEC